MRDEDEMREVCPRSDWERIEVSISFQFQIKVRLNADTLHVQEWISRRGKLRQGERARRRFRKERGTKDKEDKIKVREGNEKRDVR